MNTIYLYDISAVIKSGAYSNTGAFKKPRKDYNFFSFPTGGLYSFNERFITDYNKAKEGDLFIACFDGVYNKLYRKQRYPLYKDNRGIEGFDDNPNIDRGDHKQVEAYLETAPEKIKDKIVRRQASSIQLKFLKTILPKIGINVLYQPELEADDWIATICYHFGQDYKIVLYADDGDLDDCAQYCKNFTKKSVSGRGELEPEVGKNFYKIFHGEAGDNYPNLYVQIGRSKVETLREAILSGLEDLTVFENVERLTDAYRFTKEEVEKLQINYDMVNPIIVDEFTLYNDKLPDHNELVNYLSSMKFKNALKRIDMEPVTSEQVTNIQKFAFSILPNYVKEFFKQKEFNEGDINNVLAAATPSNNTETSDYLLELANKYNIL